MDTIDLDIEKLCSSSFMFDEKIRRVMLDWERTNSPLWTYWGNRILNIEFDERYVIPSDREMTECNVMSNDHSKINTSDCHQRGTFFYHFIRNGDFIAYEGDLESELDMLEWLTDRSTLSLSGQVEEVNPDMLARLIEDETDVVVLIYRVVKQDVI